MQKKIYCPSCQRLVAWKEAKNGETVTYTCLICGGTIWLKEGIAWKYGKKTVAKGKAR